MTDLPEPPVPVKHGKKTHRWLKFWPQDWQRDPALRSCGMAARGLWMELICMMHEGEPYGHLTINGRQPTMRQLGTITGAGEKEAAKLIKELEEAGVFSRREDGLIFSRRMVRDNETSEVARQYGSTGGNPNLKRRDKLDSFSPITGGVNPPLNGGSNHQEAEYKNTEAEPPASPPAGRRRSLNLPGVVWRSDDGRPEVRGTYFDFAADKVLEVSGMSGDPDLRPLVAWLQDGLELSDILASICRVAGRPNYEPPGSLKFFDGPVRQRTRQVA